MKTDDPICGNCGKKRSEHGLIYRGDVLSCDGVGDGNYSGYDFLETPNAKALAEFIQQRFPSVYDDMVQKWRQENGHE